MHRLSNKCLNNTNDEKSTVVCLLLFLKSE